MLNTISAREQARFAAYRANLQEGIEYYKSLVPQLVKETERYREIMRSQLMELEQELTQIVIPYPFEREMEYAQAVRIASVG